MLRKIRGNFEENNQKFNCIAGDSGGEASSEVSLDEIRYDDHSSHNAGTIESASSAEEYTPTTTRPPSHRLDGEKFKDVATKQNNRFINTKITEVIEKSSHSSEILTSSIRDVQELNSSGELVHASTAKGLNTL